MALNAIEKKNCFQKVLKISYHPFDGAKIWIILFKQIIMFDYLIQLFPKYSENITEPQVSTFFTEINVWMTDFKWFIPINCDILSIST